MNLTKIVRRIQYQTAKLEVIEFLFWHGKNNQPSLEIEMAHNMLSTLRLNLFSASEDCLNASLDTMQAYVASLKDTLVGATNFLTQMNSSLTSTEMQVVFLKELFTNIIAELVTLNAELSNGASQLFQRPSDDSTSISQFLGLNSQQSSSVAIDLNSTNSVIDRQFKSLINKCMGDAEKAERLVQYECQRNSQLDREGAIRSAITRWESDNR